MELGFCYRMKNNIPSGTRYETCRSIHAEQNAIIQAGQDRCMGASMYIWGHNFICILCKRFIVQAGHDRCMGSSMYIWGHNFICILCKRFIVQSGIETIYLKKDENSPIKVVTAQELRDELSNDAMVKQ